MSILGEPIKRPESGCDNCFFKGPKRVGSRGNPKSRFVIVGESPGIMEVIDGYPFAGPSGNFLDQIFDEFKGQLPEEDYPYIINAIKCFPRGKDTERLQAAVTACHNHVLDEIKSHPRDVILTLGNGALWSMTSNMNLKVTRERGRVFSSSLASSGIVATVHPAFLMRGSGNLQQFRSDIALALKLLREGRPRRPDDVRYAILERPSQVRALARLLGRLDSSSVIAADIETTGFSFLRDRMLSTGIQFTPGFVYIIPGHLSIPELWISKARYVWHNGKFDIKFHHQRGEPARCDEDTMLMNYALNEKRGIHDLDQLGIDHLKVDPHKGMIDQYLKGKRADGSKKDYSDIPFPILAKYQAIDIAKTYMCYFVLRDKMQADPIATKLYSGFLMDASDFLIKVEKRGLTQDMPWVEKNDAYLEAHNDQYEAAINEVAIQYLGTPINIRSPVQVKTLLYGTFKLGHRDKSTDKDTLLDLLRKVEDGTDEHKVVSNLLLYRGSHKQWATYTHAVPKYLQPDGKVHATYLIHGTGTGRLASRDPNKQNEPRDPMIRGQTTASEGKIFLEPDLSQAELRSLATLSRDRNLVEIFNSTDRSLHNEVASELFGADFSGEEKMIAKNVNFGIVYGITAVGLYLQLVSEGVEGYSVKDCQRWLEGWADQFPEAWDYIQKCRDSVLNRQTITTIFGRRKRHGVIARERLKMLQDEASNFPHQSIASDIVLKSCINIDDMIHKKYGANIVNLVHDSNLTEVDDNEEKARQTAIAIMDEFTQVPIRMGLTIVPFKSECKIGRRWGAAKDVREKDVRMKSGKILRAHPQWVLDAKDFMREWDPKKDPYPNFGG